MDIELLINNTAFFKGLSKAHRSELARICDVMTVKKRDYLFPGTGPLGSTCQNA